MIIDLHCHYTFTRRAADGDDRFSFEPATGGDGPTYDSFVSPRMTRRVSWRLMRRMLGMAGTPASGPELDRELERFYDAQLSADGPIDRYVLLAFDDYHDHRGRRPPPPESGAQVGADIYTSNTLVRRECRAQPDRFLFGASVHPYRENAVACIDEVFAAGACLLKWLPLHQNIDVADSRTLAVLRRCAELGLPLLVHYNEEFTLTTQHREHRSVTALLDVLRRLRGEGRMPTVIVAHVATPVTVLGDRETYAAFLEALLDEFRDAPLYADISALTAFGKNAFLDGLVRRQELHGKLLFGTDFPVPVATARLRRRLGGDYGRIAAEPSLPQRVAHIYRALGFNEIVFQRAAELLPHVDFFAAGASPS